MPVAWFIARYQHRLLRGGRIAQRVNPVDAFTAQIGGDGGAWAECEALGQRAVVKVRASAGTITLIGQAPGVTRIPLGVLDDPLSTLTAGQRTNLRSLILDMGWTAADINARFPAGLASVTLGELLRFAASRRRAGRYDPTAGGFVDQARDVTPGDVDRLDAVVTP